MEKVFRYRFGFSIKLLKDGSKEYVDLGIGSGEPEFQMLSYLSVNKLPATKNIIENLERVLRGDQEYYGVWGADFCNIVSFKDRSSIQHCLNPENGEMESENKFQIDISTQWLLQMMKDWKLFLETNPKEKYL